MKSMYKNKRVDVCMHSNMGHGTNLSYISHFLINDSMPDGIVPHGA